jgi:ketosteroid isomerase-like protein
MTSTELVQAFYAAGSSGDAKKLTGFFAEDAIWDNRIDDDPMGGLYEGRDAIRSGLLESLFQYLPEGISTEVERLMESDGTVVCLNTGRGRTVDGHSFEKRYAHLFDVLDGHFTRVIEFRS